MKSFCTMRHENNLLYRWILNIQLQRNTFVFFPEAAGVKGDSGAMKAESHSDRRKRTESAEAGPPGKPPLGNEDGCFSHPYFIFKAAN
ncbi:MAG: hypothetical protein EA344_01545 [Alkalicoccus sp.]|nr:MAG: hypothetical protein EA344_01545 [Alkalicoccus sp.]